MGQNQGRPAQQNVQAGAAGGQGQGAVQGNGAQGFGQGVPGQNILQPGVIMGQAQLQGQPQFAAQGIAGLLGANGQGNFQVFRRGALRRNGGHHRVRYTAAQKENALRLLNLGLSYRQVARMTSPHCSSGTPHRWRREAARREEQRRRLEELRRRRRW